MKQVYVRFREGDADATFSDLSTDGFECVVVERPWVDLDNNGKRDRKVSRIVGGKFLCLYNASAHRKNKDGTPEFSYELQAVPDADGIRIHSANWADQLEGCLALGAMIADIERQDGTMKKGVSASRPTIETFVNHMNKEPFELTISREAAC